MGWGRGMRDETPNHTGPHVTPSDVSHQRCSAVVMDWVLLLVLGATFSGVPQPPAWPYRL